MSGVWTRTDQDRISAVRGGGGSWRITGDTLWHSGESIGFRNVLIREPRTRNEWSAGVRAG